jgi:cell division protease FtsH
MGASGASLEFDQSGVPQGMRTSIAVYEAGRALVGYITPDYDEIQRVSRV